MDNFFEILRTIYLNRYRKLTFKDASAFWVILGAYLLLIYKIFNQTFPKFPQLDFTEYVIIYFSFAISNYVNERTDWELLRGFLSKTNVYFVYFIDLILANSLNLITSIYCGYDISSFSIIGLILFFTFYKIQSNKPRIYLPISNLDVLNKIGLRKNRFIYLILIICYYVIYQSLIKENRDLYMIISIVIIYIILEFTNTTEKLEYFLLSKLNTKQYILKNEFEFFKTSLIILIPSYILTIIFKTDYLIYGLLTLSCIPLCFPLKYINIGKRIPIALTQFLVLVLLLSIILNDEIDWILSIPFISIILHLISFRKFTKEKIQKEADYYLK